MIVLYFQEAFNNRYVSGSTATVVLLVDGQILVANVGDSKAVLCSEKIKPAVGDGGLILPSTVKYLWFDSRSHLLRQLLD